MAMIAITTSNSINVNADEPRPTKLFFNCDGRHFGIAVATHGQQTGQTDQDLGNPRTKISTPTALTRPGPEESGRGERRGATGLERAVAGNENELRNRFALGHDHGAFRQDDELNRAEAVS